MNARQIVLASRPKGLPDNENFRFESVELDDLREGEVLLKSLFISVDPYMRGRMNDTKSYAASYQVDKPIAGGVVARIVESKNHGFLKDDMVYGTLPWSTYSIEHGDKLRKIDVSKVPPEYYLGILGMPGLTAYFGITDIGKPKKGETVVVSGAAGAVGIVAGQISKILGARVVGIAGSDEKCALLKNEFGFDEAINYKTAKIMKKSVAAACPDGVDVYYDNVGGEITDAVILNLNFHSRIALCGQIAYYNSREIPVGPVILPRLLTRSVKLQGFIVSNYSDRFEEGLTALNQWVKEGKLKYTQTIAKGFDSLPDAFLGLFSGRNTGKMIVQIE
ncbi:MAG TPA: NADP-dependent oxidoreductase [Bacteroidales bacterium]|nr:NADP-dependent oxidoreductase [Bacteroidales bacterium]